MSKTNAPKLRPTRGKLTDRQRLFCEHLNRGMSATEAARKAGYSEGYADRHAHLLLEKNESIRAYMANLRADSRDESVADGLERRRLLTRMLRGEVDAPFVTGQGLERGDPDHGARIKAAELLAKMDGDLAPIKFDVKVTGKVEDWMREVLRVLQDFLPPDKLREATARFPRLEL